MLTCIFDHSMEDLVCLSFHLVELLNMKISSDKQHMYTLNMHISIPNIVLLKLPCSQLLLSSADYHYKQLRSRSGPNKLSFSTNFSNLWLKAAEIFLILYIHPHL